MSELVGQTGKDTSQHPLLRDPNGLLDRCSTWIADRSSPLLVKETRGAIKSRQFFYTFLVLLLAMVIWSFLGISNSIYYGKATSGVEQLIGYFWVLAFPLHIIIPFTAFRSLMREFEDDTLQLVSITSLSSRGIIFGKLGSAALQMVVYLAALVPGIAFSYLLRGVDLIQIFSLLAVLIASSLGLTTLGLLIGSVGRQLFLRIFAHLVLLATLAGSFLLFCTFVSGYLTFGANDIPWEGIYFSISLFLAISILCLETAISCISFYAENRSTNVRLAISFLMFVIVSGIILVATSEQASSIDFCPMISGLLGHLLAVFGAMMATEYPVISQRVRRGIPNTFWGESVWGLLLPGPGRGYLFSVTLIWGWIVGLNLLAPLHDRWNGRAMPDLDDWWGVFFFGVTNATFATLYVSLAYLFGRLAKTRMPRPAPIFGLLLVIVTYVLTWVVSVVLSIMMAEFLGGDFGGSRELGLATFFCWPLALEATYDRSLLPMDYVYLGFNLSLMIVLGLFCLVPASREIILPQAMVPQRVLDEQKKRKRVVATQDEETVEELFRNRNSPAASQHPASGE
jgi:hypothetical protein